MSEGTACGEGVGRRTEEAAKETGTGSGATVLSARALEAERYPGAGGIVLRSERLLGCLGVRPGAWRNGRPFGDGKPGRKGRWLGVGVGREDGEEFLKQQV